MSLSMSQSLIRTRTRTLTLTLALALTLTLTVRAAHKAGGKRQRVDNREAWPAEAAGKRYLAFTLYKENRDTLQAVQELARLLRVGQNLFGFAGTKDRRGVTSQRVTLYRVPAQKLLDAFKRRPFGDQLAVGGLAYVAEPLKLGMLGGNRFTIVLRDVKRAPCAPDGQGAADAASSGDAASSDGATHSDEVSQLTLTLTLTLTPTPTPNPNSKPSP